jgi:subtilase family serine protease
LFAAAAASATPMRPALTNLPFTQISAETAKAALQTPFCAPVNKVCYAPAHLQQAYDFPTGRNAPTGAGQTILIVTAFGSPFGIEQDLAQFDAENGLPAPPSFTVVPQKNVVTTNSSGDLMLWAIETSLDVEYAHAMAPGANIVLAVAATDDSQNFAQLEKEVLPQYPTAIVSQSFGADETGLASDQSSAAIMDKVFLSQVLHGGTVVAASGDFGASGLTPFVGAPSAMAGYPASSPYVLSVGGTMGGSYPTGLWNNGAYGSEQAWNELLPTGSCFPCAGAGGGAPSVVYRTLPWQRGLVPSSGRAVPDVSYNAAANGGVIVVLGGRHGVVGGTSAGAPQWAAIVALANEVRGRRGSGPLGLATPQLWSLAHDRGNYRQDFHDIVTGNNTLFGAGSGLPGFTAVPGYDYATGLGTPDVSRLLKDLSKRDDSRFRFDNGGDSHGGGDNNGGGNGNNGGGDNNGGGGGDSHHGQHTNFGAGG